MNVSKAQKFKARIEIIGINPFVFVPAKILAEIFKQSGKNKGQIPVRGSVNRKAYKQTLVRYSGDWRLYINTTMLKDSPKRIGEIIEITIVPTTTQPGMAPVLRCAPAAKADGRSF